jgi:hypothetical protein
MVLENIDLKKRTTQTAEKLLKLEENVNEAGEQLVESVA